MKCLKNKNALSYQNDLNFGLEIIPRTSLYTFFLLKVLREQPFAHGLDFTHYNNNGGKIYIVNHYSMARFL